MVRVAFLFTGAYRTFDSTHRVIREHLFETNPDCRAFVFAENDADPEGSAQTIRDRWGSHLGDVSVLKATRTEEYIHILRYLLQSKPAIQPQAMARTGISQGYVINSGSILEYYQFMKCYDLMLAYEKKHNVVFDYVVRTRLDVVFPHPMRLTEFFSRGEVDEATLRSLDIDEMRRGYEEKRYYDPPLTLPVGFDRQNIVWTFRKNVVWIGSRRAMDRLYPLVYFYGQYDDGTPWVFNSETQFQEFLKHHGIHHLDYYTDVEERYMVSREANQNLIVSGGDTLTDRWDKRLMMCIFRLPNFHFDKP